MKKEYKSPVMKIGELESLESLLTESMLREADSEELQVSDGIIDNSRYNWTIYSR